MKLEDFYNSEYFQAWDSDNRSTGGCGIILDDPERFDRMYEAAEFGSEGSTHAEIIQDWRDCLNTLKVVDPEFDEPEDCFTDIEDGQILESNSAKLEKEIDDCMNWHVENKSIDNELC